MGNNSDYSEKEYKPSGYPADQLADQLISFWKISQSLGITYLNYLLKRKRNFYL